MWARFAKGVLGTDNVDAQLGDGLPAEVVLGLPGATIADLDTRRAVVLVAPDLKEELPVLYLRVRRAAVELGVPLIELAPRASGLTRDATAVLRHAPGEAGAIAEQFARALAGDGTASGDGSIEKAVSALDGRDGDVVVVLGRPSLAESPTPVVQAAAALAALPGRQVPLRAAARQRARRARPRPHARASCPGGSRSTPAGRVSPSVGRCPRRAGLDATGILAAAAERHDRHARAARRRPAARLPRPLRCRAGLDAVGSSSRSARSSPTPPARADVFLPVTVWGEKSGTTTNLEGRVHAPGAARSRPTARRWTTGGSRRSSRSRFGVDFDLETVEEVQDEIARVAPALRRRRRRAAPPRARRRGAPDRRPPRRDRASRRRSGSPTGVSWEPIPPGVAADESHLAHGTGVVDQRHRRRRRSSPGSRRATRPRPTASERGRVRRRPARGAAPLHRGTARRRRRAGAARRVHSPPRGRPHALRRRTHRVARARRSPRSRPGAVLRRAPERPRAHRRRATATTCGSPAPRGTVTLPVRRRRRDRARAPRSCRSRQRGAGRPDDLVDLDRAGHRAAGGDDAVTPCLGCSSAATRSSTTASTSRSCSS